MLIVNYDAKNEIVLQVKIKPVWVFALTYSTLHSTSHTIPIISIIILIIIDLDGNLRSWYGIMITIEILLTKFIKSCKISFHFYVYKADLRVKAAFQFGKWRETLVLSSHVIPMYIIQILSYATQWKGEL